MEGARAYALDLDEEEEEEEEEEEDHQEDDWVRLHNGPAPTLIDDSHPSCTCQLPGWMKKGNHNDLQVPSDENYEPMDESAIPDDPTMVDEPMDLATSEAGEQPGEAADVFLKPTILAAESREASSTPSLAKSTEGSSVVQSGGKGSQVRKRNFTLVLMTLTIT